MIEHLQKQVLVYEAKLAQQQSGKDQLLREVQKYQVEFNAIKSEMELLQLHLA